MKNYLKYAAFIIFVSLFTMLLFMQLTTSALEQKLLEGNELTKEIEALNIQAEEIQAKIKQKEESRLQVEEEVNKMTKKLIHDEKEPAVFKNIGNFVPTESGGMDEFLKKNGAEFVKEAGDVFRSVGEHYKIKPEMLIAIATADSSLGQALKGKNNIGNVGSFDRGGTIHYATLEAGIEAMGKTLNNGYLGSHTTVGELSNGGRTALGLKACGVDGAKCYATSPVNWNVNVLASLRDMYQDDSIDENWNFRTE